MRNTARLKRIIVLLVACLLIALVAVFFNKKTAGAPAVKPETQKQIEPLPFVGPIIPPAAKQKQIKKTKAATAKPAVVKSMPVFANQDEAKAYLKTLLPERDFIIMEAVVQCESGWEHYRPSGEVKVAGGNVGFGQINRGAHYQKFLKQGLDIYNQKDNLRATAQLYKDQGINPWKPYSGKCFLPKLKAKGIQL